MLQFDANAHADANVDARVNGPLLLCWEGVSVGQCEHGFSIIMNPVFPQCEHGFRTFLVTLYVSPAQLMCMTLETPCRR